MKIRLERKFAELIDDVNVSKYRVGDVIELPWHDAKMLLAEGWAVPLEPEAESAPSRPTLVVLPDRSKQSA
jgi:hypothetical protein